MATDAQISIQCSQELEKLGYSKTVTDRRIQVNSKISQSMTSITHNFFGHIKVDKILVGSRREGISLFGESDTDVMFILNDVLCVEKSKCIRDTPPKTGLRLEDSNNKKTLFVMDTSNASCGYSLLQKDSSSIPNEFTDCSVLKENSLFLSSSNFLRAHAKTFQVYQGWMKKSTIQTARNGPSLPEFISHNDTYQKFMQWFIRDNNVSNEKDCVPAIPCECSSLLHKWQTRDRLSRWPTPEMVEEVVKLPVYVVPVGSKGSQHADLEWRISFTLAEIYLVQNLDDDQVKTLVLLRMIAKEKLKPVCSKISSYVVKNISLWLAESNKSGTVLKRVKDGLLVLRDCICKKYLPCYMLPDRNLLELITDKEMYEAKNVIDQIIVENNFASFVLQLIKKRRENKLGFCASLDGICLNIYQDMTPLEIERITSWSCKSSTSFGQHLQFAYYLLIPYIRKKGWRKTMECVRRSGSSETPETKEVKKEVTEFLPNNITCETRPTGDVMNGNENNGFNHRDEELIKCKRSKEYNTRSEQHNCDVEKVEPLARLITSESRKTGHSFKQISQSLNIVIYVMMTVFTYSLYAVIIHQLNWEYSRFASKTYDIDVFWLSVEMLYFQYFIFQTFEKYGYFKVLEQLIMFLECLLSSFHDILSTCLQTILALVAFTQPRVLWHLTEKFAHVWVFCLRYIHPDLRGFKR